jgi:hypothetical protein
MNESTNTNYLSNPYVLIGGVLIAYWFFQRKKIIRSNKDATKSITLIEKEKQKEASFNSFIEEEAKKNGVPIKLVRDAQEMSKKDVARMILDNQKMINSTKMSNDERRHILRMVDYLENELDKK